MRKRFRVLYLDKEVKLLTSYRTREAVLLPTGTRMKITAVTGNRFTLQTLTVHDELALSLYGVPRGAFELL